MGLRDELLHDAIFAALMSGAGYLIYRKYFRGISQFHEVVTGTESLVRGAMSPQRSSAVVREKLLRDHGIAPYTYITTDQQKDIASKELVATVMPKGYITTDEQHALAAKYLAAKRRLKGE